MSYSFYICIEKTPLKRGDDTMATTSITQPMKVKASELKKLNSDTKLSESMVRIMVSNKDVYKNVGNAGIIKSLKL